MKRNFELNEHTADIRILAKGADQSELFESALAGLCEVLLPEEQRQFDKSAISSRTIEIESIDTTALLVDFLSDCLSFMHEENALISRVEFFEILPEKIKVRLYASLCADGFAEDVKAVTYHEADVRQDQNGLLESTIIIDV